MSCNEDSSGTEVLGVFELLDKTTSESRDQEDGNYLESFEHNDKMEGPSVTMVEDVIMDAKTWKHLPRELHAYILQFFTVPQLCRLRVVCRAWNDLIQKLDFTLKARPQNMYIFKAPHFIDISSMTMMKRIFDNEEITIKEIKDLLQETSELFDLGTQKVYLINMEFLCDNVRSRFTSSERCQIIAADRGFVCVLWSEYFGLIQVANLVTRSVIDIPPIYEDTFYKHVTGVMTVMEDYSSFTIYVLFAIENSRKPCLAQFDLQVGKWQELPRLPETLTPSHMLKLNEMLYTLFWERDNNVYKMFALDTAHNAWTDMGVELPKYVSMPQLATARGRLFFVGFDDLSKDDLSSDSLKQEHEFRIEILQIDIASQQHSIVTTMDETENKHLLEAPDCLTVHREFQGTGDSTAVVGYGDFIVLTSITGQSIAYDLVNHDWSKWSSGRRIADMGNKDGKQYDIPYMRMSPTLNPIFEYCVLPRNRDEIQYGIFAMPMTLTLNHVPLPRVQQPH